MKIQSTLLLAGILAGGLTATTAAATHSEGMVVTPGGTMRVQIAIPVLSDVDLTTPVTAGRIEIAYSMATSAIAHFSLNHLTLNFANFSFSRSYPVGTKNFRAIGVHLPEPVDIYAFEAPPGVFHFTLTPNDVVVYGSAMVNGDLKTGNDSPTEDVTGTIDLNTNTFTAHVVMHQEGEFAGLDVGGPLTINLSGPITRRPKRLGTWLEPDWLPVADFDTDHDGTSDGDDNCLLVANPNQEWVASPVVVAPPPVRSGTCAVTKLGVATGVDVCGGLTVTFAQDAPPTFPVGGTEVTWVGATAAGGAAKATQRVEVVDKTPPVFLSVPPSVTISACTPIDIGVATATDDCGSDKSLVTNDAPGRFPPGRTVVTWTATDGAGNRAQASQLVTVTSCEIKR